MKLQHHVSTPASFLFIIIVTAATFLAAPLQAQQDDREFIPVTDAMLQDPDPDDWLMWRRTLNTWGFSPLDQIDRDNVASLRLVWTRPLGPGA